MKSTVVALVCMFVVGHTVMGGINEQKLLSAAVFDFGQRLHQKMISDNMTMVCSPVGLHALLAKALYGARNETADEMSRVLNLTSLPGILSHETYREIVREVNPRIAFTYGAPKGILVNPRHSIEEDFKNYIGRIVVTKVSNFNLSASEGAEKEINEYVAERTQNLIKDMVPEGSIDDNDSLLLVSAFIANATWQNQFNKSKTEKSDFFHLDGMISKVDMMKDIREVLMKRDYSNGVDVVQLPLKGERVGLYIVLPHTMDDIFDLEKRVITSSNASELFEDLERCHLQMAIPRFKIESNYQLRDAVRDVGMVKAVTPGVADFTGISKSGNLHISKIHHRARIDVQESGLVTTEESQLEDTTTYSPPLPQANCTIIANRPFLFFLRDNVTKLLLLQGKFSN